MNTYLSSAMYVNICHRSALAERKCCPAFLPIIPTSSGSRKRHAGQMLIVHHFPSSHLALRRMKLLKAIKFAKNIPSFAKRQFLPFSVNCNFRYFCIPFTANSSVLRPAASFCRRLYSYINNRRVLCAGRQEHLRSGRRPHGTQRKHRAG